MNNKKIVILELGKITLDDKFKIRCSVNEELILEYAESIRSGVQLPPITVWRSDGKMYCVDGWHRLAAHKRAKKPSIEAEIIDGSLEEAVMIASLKNNQHGLRLANEDKIHVAQRALEWFGEMSDRAIAQKCGLSPNFIGKCRKKHQVAGAHGAHVMRLGLDGKAYKIKTEPCASTTAQVNFESHESNRPSVGSPPANEVVAVVRNDFDLDDDVLAFNFFETAECITSFLDLRFRECPDSERRRLINHVFNFLDRL